MRKAFMFVVLAILAMAVPASAQSSLWRYFGVCQRGDELCRVMVGNQQMLREMRTGYMGYYRGDGFYATHDPNGRPLPRLVKIAVGAGIGAAILGGVGDLVGHGREGALIGAGIGALIGARHGSGNNNQRATVVPSPGQGGYVGADGIPVATGTRRSEAQPSLGIVNQSRGLTRRAVNRTGMEVAVFQTGADPSREEPMMVLARGEGFEVTLTDGGYDVYILVPINRLGVQDVRRATVVPNHDLNGWDIVVAP